MDVYVIFQLLLKFGCLVQLNKIAKKPITAQKIMIIHAKKGALPLICIMGIPLLALSILLIKDIVRNFGDNIYITISYAGSFVGLSYYVLVFGLAGFLDFIRSRVSKNAVLTITNRGINDHLSVYSSGDILWTEITEIKIVTGERGDYLIIEVTDPQKFISRKITFLRLLLKYIFKKYGSPVFVAQRKVDCNLGELKKLLEDARANISVHSI